MIDMVWISNELRSFLALVNFAACSAIGWSCVCRFAVMSSETTKKRFIGGYVTLFLSASASGLSPWLFNEWPGLGQIAMALSALYVLGFGVQNWRGGPPDCATKPGDLGSAS